MQITVGLDFGTHQTKICTEIVDGNVKTYEFSKFKYSFFHYKYTLPSIILEKSDGRLDYGYVSRKKGSKIIKYFKQSVFTNSRNISYDDAVLYSIWYIAYILFDLEKKYGRDFAIQMGVPTDGENFVTQQRLAVSIVASAYKLVEDVFKNNKSKFLDCKKSELIKKTEIVPFSIDTKINYGVLIFPEAYACLMPLVKSKKIDRGMSLMVDIGGGTTDISFFTIPDYEIRIYKFYSIDKGLNYLTDAFNIDNNRLDSNVQENNILIKNRIDKYFEEVKRECGLLSHQLTVGFLEKFPNRKSEIVRSLNNRPIVYTGGGSTFENLRIGYIGFNDIIPVSYNIWKTAQIKDFNNIKLLCPILSTAYGLSMGVPKDKINTQTLESLFGCQDQNAISIKNRDSLMHINKFDYGLCDDAWK